MSDQFSESCEAHSSQFPGPQGFANAAWESHAITFAARPIGERCGAMTAERSNE